MPTRLATPEDITAALKLGRITLERSVIAGDLDELHARRVMLRCINDANMSMWVAEHKGEIVGFLMTIKEQHWFSKARYAADICFCVSPQHGNYAPSIIRKYVKWAKADSRVKDINLAISSGLDQDGRAGQMYQNLGFTNVGGVYSLLENTECQV